MIFCAFNKIVPVIATGLICMASNAYADSAPVAVTDLRVKLGTAAQANKVTMPTQYYTGNSWNSSRTEVYGSGSVSSNFQLEGNVGIYYPSNIGLIICGGIFSRKHSGDFYTASTAEYTASGLSLGMGIGFKPTDNLNFAVKYEIGMGKGEATLTDPGYVTNTSRGNYTSNSFILGAYYTINNPGFQIGLEIGSQSFNGEYYYGSGSGTVEGSSNTANIVLGYCF